MSLDWQNAIALIVDITLRVMPLGSISVDWQNLIAVVLVATAIGYLGRSAWQVLARPKRAGCGSCPSCPAEKAGSATPDVVSLDRLVESAKRE